MAMQPIAFKLPAKASIFAGLGLVGIIVLIFVFRSPPQEENGVKNDQPLDHQNQLSEQPGTQTNNSSQAEAIFATLRDSLKQPRDFPFHPVWSGEVYDPKHEIDAAYQERLKRHVLLRNFYTSSVRFSPEFRQLHHLLEQWNVAPDPMLRIKIFAPMRGLEMTREMVNRSDPQLVNPQIRQEMEQLVMKNERFLTAAAKSWLGVEDPAFIRALLEIRPERGFGVPNTHIEPGEPLLER